MGSVLWSVMTGPIRTGRCVTSCRVPRFHQRSPTPTVEVHELAPRVDST